MHVNEHVFCNLCHLKNLFLEKVIEVVGGDDNDDVHIIMPL